MKITIDTALTLLKNGQAIGFPTDTVYGIAADYKNESAVDLLYELKGRDYSKPIIILAASIDQVTPLIDLPIDTIRSDLNQFWPGAVSLILPANSNAIPPIVRNNGNSIGIRIPNHPLALQLLEITGPLAVTSANFSGQPPAWNANQVETIFGTDFPVLDGGESTHKEPSTILQYNNGSWNKLRG